MRDELKNEIVTRELFEGRFNLIDERFKTIEKSELVTRELFEERFKTIEKNELITRELFEGRFKGLETEMNERFKRLEIEMNERFNVVNEKFKGLNFKMNIFIAIALIALTFANPTFVQLIEKIFGF